MQRWNLSDDRNRPRPHIHWRGQPNGTALNYLVVRIVPLIACRSLRPQLLHKLVDLLSHFEPRIDGVAVSAISADQEGGGEIDRG